MNPTLAPWPWWMRPIGWLGRLVIAALECVLGLGYWAVMTGLYVGIPLTVLYVLLRFVKWSWTN
jgi:hypothetical protein